MNTLGKNAVIIIDDDPIHNAMCKKILWSINPLFKIIVFTSPEEGLAYLQSYRDEPAFLLLDINMPGMSGWEFLEQFDTLPVSIKSTVTIYMASSSIDENDIKRAKSSHNISGYLSKPLTKAKLSIITPKL